MSSSSLPDHILEELDNFLHRHHHRAALFPASATPVEITKTTPPRVISGVTLSTQKTLNLKAMSSALARWSKSRTKGERRWLLQRRPGEV